jgi:rod shape-determining protein MreD
MQQRPSKKQYQHLKVILHVIITVFIGMCFTIAPWYFGRTWFYPSWVLMILVFWLIFFQNYLNLFVFWVVGLFMDVLTGTLMGQTAFIFVLTAYSMMRFLNRFISYTLWRQSIFWIILSTMNALVIYCTNALTGNVSFYISYCSTILLNALLWPAIFLGLYRCYHGLILQNK